MSGMSHRDPTTIVTIALIAAGIFGILSVVFLLVVLGRVLFTS
jgi:hypothetical protein